MTWQPGQRAAINREQIVTIDRVTPSGRAMVSSRTFAANGKEVGYKGRGQSRLEPITPEIEAEIALLARGRAAFSRTITLAGRAEQWARKIYTPWTDFAPSVADVEKAERLAAAIAKALGGTP